VRIAEENDHPWTLFLGLYRLGMVHLLRGDFACAERLLERSLQLGRTWQFVDRIPDVGSLSGAYALAGRTEESLALVVGAVKAYRARQGHVAPANILLRAGRAYLAAGRIDEATSYAREVLALTRQLGVRGMRPAPSL
jgi:Flp pilus assembly protein TadD